MKQIDRFYVKTGGFELEIVNAFSALSVGIILCSIISIVWEVLSL